MTDEQLRARFEDVVDDRLHEHTPLAPFSHYKIGGDARWFVEVKTSEELVAIMNIVREAMLDWAILGGGTNVLINDNGFYGLIIRAAHRSIQINEQDGVVVSEAGALSSMVARKTADAGLTGFEWAVSLPGTMGGAVRGNAGCFGGEMKDTVTQVEVYDLQTGEVKMLSNKDLQFDYRESLVKHSDLVVLRVTMRLDHDTTELTKEKIDAVLKCRLETQPKNAKCAGCAFKNFTFQSNQDVAKLVEVFGEDLPAKFIENKRVAAGWLIDKLDLKGTRVGGAAVSDIHGNFITNDGTATADDIAQLIAIIKTKVRDRVGIQLQEEIQYIGF